MNQEEKMDDEIMVHARLLASRSKFWTPQLEKMCREWKRQIGERQTAHNKQSAVYSRRHYIIGTPSVFLSAIVSSGIFLSFQNCTDGIFCSANEWIRLVCGVISLCSMALTAIFVFLDYQTRAEQHKSAYSSYETLSRDIESILRMPITFRGDPIDTVKGFQDKFNDLTKSSPSINIKTPLDTHFKLNQDPRVLGPTDLNILPQLNESCGKDTKQLAELLNVSSSKDSDDVEMVPVDINSIQVV